jgi:hypothetical protein
VRLHRSHYAQIVAQQHHASSRRSSRSFIAITITLNNETHSTHHIYRFSLRCCGVARLAIPPRMDSAGPAKHKVPHGNAYMSRGLHTTRKRHIQQSVFQGYTSDQAIDMSALPADHPPVLMQSQPPSSVLYFNCNLVTMDYEVRFHVRIPLHCDH